MNKSIVALVIVVGTARLSLGGIETHHTTMTWEGSDEPGHSFTANPVPLFDSMGGTRRLSRVRIIFTQYWEGTMSLDNPLPLRQCVEYTEGFIEAQVAASACQGFEVLGQGPTRNGRIGADPMQQTLKTLTWNDPTLSFDFTLRDYPFDYLGCIGVGLITFRSARFSGGFSTFLVNNPEPDCSGGFLGGGPVGFSTPHRKIESQVTWEYHWIPSSCPVDLTTLSTPGSQFYGEPDGIVDSHDFFYYLDQFALGNLAVADLTTNARPGLPGYGVPNGAITNDDFFYFLIRYAEGC